MSDTWLKKPRSMGSLLPPNYISDEGRFDLNLPRIRPAWLMNESITSLDSKFPMVPAPTGSIVFYTTPLGEKLRQQPNNGEFDLTDPLRPSLSYNCLHDQHLQVYFRSNDVRKRLLDDGFITDDGYVKCTLKEFNEYRQWIRKLKLDELHRERRQDEKQIEDAKKERLERIALERDPELLELMKRRREKRREEAKMHQKRIKREQERVRKLEEIDRQRREKFMEMRRKTRDRIQIKRDLERERLRKKKCDEERQDREIKLRIATKIDRDNEERLHHLEERKKEAKKLKMKKLEEQWLRRESWSVEYHENQKKMRELQQQEFHQHVEERNARVAKQRRWSQVTYNEIAEANRRTFESQMEKAEAFLAKLNDKKAAELQHWRKKFDAMQKTSQTSLGSCLIKKIKQRVRRQSAWDLESCLLKDLGLADQEIKENSYTKLGVISRSNEFTIMGDIMGDLGIVREEKQDEGQNGREFRFSIPTIVESLASIREPSSDSESDDSFRTPSVFRFESIHDLPCISDSPEPDIKPNDHIPEDKMRTFVKTYVQDILRQSADKLGVQIKFQRRTPREEIPRITDVTKTPNEKEVDGGDAHMRAKVREYLSGILDKVEDEMQVCIKRPREYEKIKEKTRPGRSRPVETTVGDVIDSGLNYRSKRAMVRQYICKIVKDAAKQSKVDVKFPPHYQSLAKREDKPLTKVPSGPSNQIADEHKDVLAALASGTLVLEPVEEKPKSMVVGSSTVGSEIERTASAIDMMRNKYDKVRAERLFHENLLMMATRTVIQALHDAVLLVRAQRRNSDFFMSDMPNLFLEDNVPSCKEKAVLLKQQRSNCRRKIKIDETEHIPREIDFLESNHQHSVTKGAAQGTGSKDPNEKKGGKNISFQISSPPSRQSEKKGTSKIDKLAKKYDSGKMNGSVTPTGNTAGRTENEKPNAYESGTTAASAKPSEEIGKDLKNALDQVIVTSSLEIRSSYAVVVKISTMNLETKSTATVNVAVAKEMADAERVLDPSIEAENESKASQRESKGDKLNLKDTLGDVSIEAAVSISTMKSPSLLQVTPQSSGFGVQDEIRPGAIPPNTETTSRVDRETVGSPSSAIYRVISMREQREHSDLSPQSSYVVLPTLTPSEGSLINTKMAQYINDSAAELKFTGMESSSVDHFPELSPSPSREISGVAADHTNKPVKLPSVTSIEACPSRSPSPPRPSPRSSQVTLPQIGISKTSLVGNNESTQVNDKQSDLKQDTRPKTPSTIAVPVKSTTTTKPLAKATPPAKPPHKNTGQPGKPPTRAKSEMSRKPRQIVTQGLTRKDGQALSTTALVTHKAATESRAKKKPEIAKPVVSTPPTRNEPQKRLPKSKSIGETILTAGPESKRRKSVSAVSSGNVGQSVAKSTSQMSNASTNASSQKSDRGKEKTNASTPVIHDSQISKDTKAIAKQSKPVSAKSTPDVKAKPAQDTNAKSTQDNPAKSTQNGHTKSLQNEQDKSAGDDNKTKFTQDIHEKSSQVKNAKPTPNKHTKSAQDVHARSARDNQTKSTQNANLSAESKTNKDINRSKKVTINQTEKNFSEKPKPAQADIQTNDVSQRSNVEMKPLTDNERRSVSPPANSVKTTSNLQAKVTSKEEPQSSSKPSPVEKDWSSTESSKGTPDTSPTPRVSNLKANEKISSKPKFVANAQVTPSYTAEKISTDCEKEVKKHSNHTILRNTESETEFFMKQHNLKFDRIDFDVEVNEPAADDVDKTAVGLLPTKPKTRKSKRKARHPVDNKTKNADGNLKECDDGTKHDTGRAVDYEDGAEKTDKKTKADDNGAKETVDLAKKSDIAQKDAQNKTASKVTSKATNIERKSSLKPDETGLLKTGSVQVASKSNEKENKVSNSRRRSVSFSSAMKQLPETKESSNQDKSLAKRRSSLKAAKRTSSKELKKRRSSLSSEHAKGKTKSNTDVISKVPSNRKISNASLSKSPLKTTRRSSKDAEGTETKSEDKAKSLTESDTRAENTQQTREEDTQKTSKTDSQEIRVKDAQETLVNVDSKDTPKQSESDDEVVVQVYVPDEQTDVSDEITGKAPQETGDHTEHTKTGKKHDETSEGQGGVVKINLTPSPGEVDEPESELKRSSSRRAFGDNVVEKKLVNIIPKNSLDTIKGVKLLPNEPREAKFSPNRPSHSKTNLPRSPTVSKHRVGRRTPPDAKALKTSNFELPYPGQALVVKVKPQGNRSQISMHRLASKMSTNLEKVDEGSPLETGSPSSSSPQELETEKLATALCISRMKTTPASSHSGTDKECSESPVQDSGENIEKNSENLEENVDKKASSLKENVADPQRLGSNKSLEFIMKTSGVCINTASFAGMVQGTPLLNKESVSGNDDVTGHTSSASLKSNTSQPLVPSPPITAKPDMVSPRISRMISRKISNGSGKSRGSFGSNEMSPTASMEIVKLASNSSHGWVSSPTSSVKFLPPIDARASKTSNRSDDSTKRRPRTAESAVSRTGSAGSGSSSESKKGAVVEIRRSGSGGLRIDGSSSGLVGVRSSGSVGSPKQAVVGF